MTAVGIAGLLALTAAGIWLGLRHAVVALVLDEETAVNNIHPAEQWRWDS